MDELELNEIINSAKSKRDLCRRLNIDTEHKSGSTINKILIDFLKSFNIEIDLSEEGFKNRRYMFRYNQYLRENPTCKECGKPIPFERYGKNFCNSSCAASFNNKLRENNTEIKTKISNSLKNYHKNVSLKTPKYRKCAVCGNEFEVQRIKNGSFSKSKTCSDECKFILKSENAKDNIKKLKSENRFKGWQTRNIESYAEKFWKEVLDNNSISYIREKKIDKYFLDFYINKNSKQLDLEIDGKQHKYPERIESDSIRDEFLQKNNIIVYRIDWNEINTNKGKDMMTQKINDFLNFYKSL